jgi:6-phosphofructokinase 1
MKVVLKMMQNRSTFPANNIPIVCMPASINNNLPGAELSIGADTALNNIVSAVDKIKQSAVASRRVFVVEVMGRNCGYLALMSALATGAERVYIGEEGIRSSDLIEDVKQLAAGFSKGKRLGLVIRNESANKVYTTSFIRALFEEEAATCLMCARQFWATCSRAAIRRRLTAFWLPDWPPMP